MVSCHKMMVSWHEMMVSCHEMTMLVVDLTRHLYTWLQVLNHLTKQYFLPGLYVESGLLFTLFYLDA